MSYFFYLKQFQYLEDPPKFFFFFYKLPVRAKNIPFYNLNIYIFLIKLSM